MQVKLNEDRVEREKEKDAKGASDGVVQGSVEGGSSVGR